MTNLNEVSKQFHARAKAKGFYEKPREIGTLLMLVVSELSEALEADRKDKKADTSQIEQFFRNGKSDETNPITYATLFKEGVKDTFEDEMADVMIRMFDLVGYLGIDIDKHIELKMKFNATRENKHGKNY